VIDDDVEECVEQEDAVGGDGCHVEKDGFLNGGKGWWW
jgi:hypothetical protein